VEGVGLDPNGCSTRYLIPTQHHGPLGHAGGSSRSGGGGGGSGGSERRYLSESL